MSLPLTAVMFAIINAAVAGPFPDREFRVTYGNAGAKTETLECTQTLLGFTLAGQHTSCVIRQVRDFTYNIPEGYTVCAVDGEQAEGRADEIWRTAFEGLNIHNFSDGAGLYTHNCPTDENGDIALYDSIVRSDVVCQFPNGYETPEVGTWGSVVEQGLCE